MPKKENRTLQSKLSALRSQLSARMSSFGQQQRSCVNDDASSDFLPLVQSTSGLLQSAPGGVGAACPASVSFVAERIAINDNVHPQSFVNDAAVESGYKVESLAKTCSPQGE